MRPFTAPLGGPYDLVIASHVFHHFSEQRCRALLHRLADVLKPDGLVIQDVISGMSPKETPFPYLFSVRMLTWTREGESHSIDVYRRLLREAGFSAPEAHAAEGMPSRFLISGRAPPRSSGQRRWVSDEAPTGGRVAWRRDVRSAGSGSGRPHRATTR